MFGKLITLIFILVTVEAFSLHSTKNEETPEINIYRLPENVVPIHYDLKIESDIAVGNYNFGGETDTKIEVREPTKEIVLNWLNLSVDEAKTRLDNTNNESVSPKTHLYDNERQMLILSFNDTIAPAIYTLHIEFSGVLSENLKGFYGSHYTEENGDKAWLAVAHFQPISARKTFPCWDEPALKATFNISLKHHAKYTALSNMPAYERSHVDGDEAKVWTRFEKTPVMSTHIVGFVIGDLGNISTPDGSIRVWGRKSLISNLRFFFDVVQKVDETFKDYMNTSVVLPKMDHVAVPDFSTRATENWGLIIYSEIAVVYNPNETTMDEEDNIIMVAVHEMAHQWISNLVGPSWWTYMWMSEGFAAYFQFSMMPKLIKDASIIDIFPLQFHREFIFELDRCPDGTPISRDVNEPSEIGRIYNFMTYRKSPTILQMLIHLITEEVFRNGLLKYVHAYQYKTAMPDDLWRFMQDALDQSNVPHIPFQIKEVMDSWFQQEGYPVVIVERDYHTGIVQVRQVGARNEIFLETCDHKWWIPLNFATETRPEFLSTLPTYWLNPSEDIKIIHELPTDGWIIANIQQTGYYRVYYDLENWKRLAYYLNSDDYDKIHVLNRFQLINDAFYAVKMNELSYDVLGMLLSYYSRETSLLPWMAGLDRLEDMDHLFEFQESSVILKPYIRHLLSNVLKDMDYKDYPDDKRWMKAKKRIFKNLSCKVDVPESLGNATEQLNEYLENPNSTNILPDSRMWVFCCGLKRANQSTWNALLDHYLTNRDEFYLRSLTCSDSTSILKNLLNMTLSDDSPFLKKDVGYIFGAMINRGDMISLDLLTDFIGENLNKLSSKTENIGMTLDYLLYKVTTMEQFNKMTAILASRGKLVNGTERMDFRRNVMNTIVTNLQTVVKMTNLPIEKKSNEIRN